MRAAPLNLAQTMVSRPIAPRSLYNDRIPQLHVAAHNRVDGNGEGLGQHSDIGGRVRLEKEAARPIQIEVVGKAATKGRFGHITKTVGHTIVARVEDDAVPLTNGVAQ